jgi:hypothetical protein
MRSVIRSAVAFFAIALAASWTTVLAQQGIDVEQIAVSAASNVCLLFCWLSSTLIEPFVRLQQSLLWGTYRPQLYHGVRARLPKSLMTGLMWFGLNDYKGFQGESICSPAQLSQLTKLWQRSDIHVNNPTV